MAGARGPEAVKQGAAVSDVKERAAELAMIARLYLTTQLRAEQLLAVADAEDRQAGLEDDVRSAWAADIDGGSWAAREDDSLGLEALERLFSGLEGRDFRIDAASRTRRAISCVTWLPKSTIRTVSGWCEMLMARL